MPSMIAAAIGGSAIAGVGSAVVGAGAAQSAAQTQANAAQNAAASQMQMFHEMQANLEPFRQGGLTGLNQLISALPSLTKPFNPTMDQLAQTPGYQFALQQGMQGTQNSFAAQGLGNSGAALKGAANYATGLASQTYQQQFGNYMAQNQQIYNMLGGLTQTGLSAATGTAQLGMQAQTQANNFMTSGAAAQAAGMIGSANAINAGIGGVSNSLSQWGMLNFMKNSGMFSGGGGVVP